MQNIWSAVLLFCQNPHLSPLISSVYECKHERRILDNILYVVGKSDVLLYLLQSLSLCAELSTTLWRHIGGGGIVPLILDLGTRRRWVVSFTPWVLNSWGKSPQYPLDRKLGVPQSQSGCSGEEKNSQLLPGIEPPKDRFSSLYWLRYPGSYSHYHRFYK
jgi:hypothetical protein